MFYEYNAESLLHAQFSTEALQWNEAQTIYQGAALSHAMSSCSPLQHYASRSNVLIAHCIPKQTIRFLIDTKPDADASEMYTFHIMCLGERFGNVSPLDRGHGLLT